MLGPNSFAANLQTSTKKRQAPQPSPSGESSPATATTQTLHLLMNQKQMMTALSDICRVPTMMAHGSDIDKCLQNKRERCVPVVFSISVLSRDIKALSSSTANPSNLRPILHQTKIAVWTKSNGIKLAFPSLEKRIISDQ